MIPDQGKRHTSPKLARDQSEIEEYAMKYKTAVTELAWRRQERDDVKI
jgi:hypothetical protein